jgi:hypothetical protein
MSHFAYIQPKNALAKDTEIHGLVAKIISKINDIPNHNEYRHNLEMLKMVCVMIEHAIDNKQRKSKIDKKDIVFMVWNRVWSGMRPEELKSLEQNIQFLWENGFIKKKKLWSVIKHSCADWFQRKILN